MKIPLSGFTLVRNGQTFDYPFLESIHSLLPLVDELVINVGRGTDQTLHSLEQLAKENPKLKLFESDWPLDDPEKKKGGQILAEQTNLALEKCSNDWCIYLQADEVLHEEDFPIIRQAVEESQSHPSIEGLLFNYLHFYGSYDVVQETRSAYRREVRAIRRSSTARSIGDAQSFRKADGSKLKVHHIPARIFHYGWVRSPEAMKEKTAFMDSLYHNTDGSEPFTGDNYKYKRFWGLKPYTGSHPSAMKNRIREKGWHWDLSQSPFVWDWKDTKKVVLDSFERMTGIRLFEYRSYDLLK